MQEGGDVTGGGSGGKQRAELACRPRGCAVGDALDGRGNSGEGDGEVKEAVTGKAGSGVLIG